MTRGITDTSKGGCGGGGGGGARIKWRVIFSLVKTRVTRERLTKACQNIILCRAVVNRIYDAAYRACRVNARNPSIIPIVKSLLIYLPAFRQYTPKNGPRAIVCTLRCGDLTRSMTPTHDFHGN